jgi:tyrosyl-tRNA synthetase
MIKLMTNSFLKEFQDRGYFYQCTNLEALKELSDTQKITAYIGFDCTAKSLHVGNMMQIMILRLLQKHGHKPIIIVGGTTTKIGDPTGKDEMRKFLSDEDIAENMRGIKECLAKFIKFGDGPTDAIMLNNSDWLEKLNYIDFLRNYGRFISVNRMLSQDSIKNRLDREQNLTFLEFNYMLFQAYDYLHLNKQNNCALQIGGSDQWSNIISGVDLVRRVNNKEVFGLTTPLLTTSSGIKMGKSVGGAVWIHENMLSPYEYFQYWRNTEDPDVEKFSRLFAEYNNDEQQEFNALVRGNINEAKKKLAHRLTELCHGLSAADEALSTAISVFEQGGSLEGLPEHQIDKTTLENGIAAYELIAECGLSDSKSEARKLIRGGGARINDEKIEDENKVITLSDLNSEGSIKLSAGKKKHLLVKPH